MKACSLVNDVRLKKAGEVRISTSPGSNRRGADALWLSMPVTELLIALYAAAATRKYANALPGGNGK